jgi:hypothetical protein
MPVRLFGLKQSTCTMRLLITLDEKGVDDYDLQEVDLMAGEHKVRAILPQPPIS